jgi:beta-N-acetylhexosaminidase
MSNAVNEIGLHFIVGIHGSRLSDEERRALHKLRPLGIILFAKNIADSESWISELGELIADAKKAINRDFIFVSVDHEGGRVQRFPKPVTSFPYAKNWKGHWEDVGRAMGLELGALGVNLNFAPVLDIHSEESNPVIGPRAFGCTVEEVIAGAIPYKKGLESQGVLSCAKHFPGHGATTSDSHFELPVLNDSLETLSCRELASFREYFLENPTLVMVAHVRYPALDNENPATLSSAIITDLLRDKMGYQGTVISDDLEMSALADLGPDEKAKRFILAGGDILLEGNPKNTSALPIAEQMAEGIRQALIAGEISESQLLESQNRIKQLISYAQSIAVSQKQDDPQRLIGCSEHLELSTQLSSNS